MIVRVENRFGTFIVRNPRPVDTVKGEAIHGIYRAEGEREWRGIGSFLLADSVIETVWGQPQLGEVA